MDIYKKSSEMILKAVNEYLFTTYSTCLPSSAVCEVPPRADLGDLATNAAMVCAKILRKSPRAIAEEFKSALEKLDFVSKVEIAGAGFLNLRFSAAHWDEFLRDVLVLGNDYGSEENPNGIKVNVEFVSANPTGPLHVGHTRGAILGNSLSIILKRAGYQVTKEYYVNDHGNQINNLLESIRYRYCQMCGTRLDEVLPPNCYPGAYINDFASILFEKYGKCCVDFPAEDFYAHFKQDAVDYMLGLIKADLKSLGIEFDVFTSETDLVDSGKVKKALDHLGDLDLTYVGKLPPPVEAKKEEENYEAEQLLFRSSAFGDASDRVVVKANGDLTYFASDIAYHYDKYLRGFSRLIDVWGADHIGYVPRMQAALKAVSQGDASLSVLLCQMVNFEKDGEPLKMSKRAGTYVLVSDVLEEVDADIFKIYMLSRNPESQVTFDLVKLTRESSDSVVFYIQYAFARTNSLLKKYKEAFGEDYDWKKIHLKGFYESASDAEKELLISIARFPSILRTSADKYVTHLIVNYISELAGQFHSYWNTDVKIIDPASRDSTDRNLLLVSAIRETIGSGLTCLGVEPKAFLTRNEEE